jgi:hypothetical protein
MIKRIFAPTMVLFGGLALGSCASVSGAVSDNWPTWLGGMPKDVPPRPGAPGYEEFLVQQQGKNPPSATAPAANANAQSAAAVAPADKAGAQAAAPGYAAPPRDQAAVQGGLY